MSTLKSDTIQSVGSNLVFANSAATETMRITSGGNVGVGTNAPTSLLHVAGTANISGTLNVGGLATLAGATSSAIISCGTAPTLGQHLCNKTYVDSGGLGHPAQSWVIKALPSPPITTRVVNTQYTNITGRPIAVSFQASIPPGAAIQVHVGGNNVLAYQSNAGANLEAVSTFCIVPTGSTYTYSTTAGTAGLTCSAFIINELTI